MVDWGAYKRRKAVIDCIASALETRFPYLSNRTILCLARGFSKKGGIDAILRATDRDLDAVHNFGERALREFRSSWSNEDRRAFAADSLCDHLDRMSAARLGA